MPERDTTIYFDNNGRPYTMDPQYRDGRQVGTAKKYLSPLVAASSSDARARQWAAQNGVSIADGRVTDNSEYRGLSVWDQNKGEWNHNYADMLYGAGVGGLVGAGALSALGGGGAAASAPSAGSGGSGVIPASFSVPSGATVPTAVQGAAGGAAAGGGTAGAALGGVAPAAAGASFTDKLKDFITNPQNVVGLAATIPALASAAGGGGNSALNDPTVQQLLQMNLKRQQRTDPLHESVTQLSMAMLPTAYQRKG